MQPVSATLRQFDSKAQSVPQGQLLADAAEFTVYKLQVTVKRESGQQTSMEVLKRYSQFDDLHEVLEKKFKKAKLPKLPGKKLIGKMTLEFIQKRSRKLEEYLNTVGSDTVFVRSEELNKFVGTSMQLKDAPAAAGRSPSPRPVRPAAEDDRAKKEAEDMAKIEAEEKAKKGAEEKSRKEAQEEAKKEAEDKERAVGDEAAKARKEAEEKAKREAEEKARKEAEDKAKKEAEEKAKQAAADTARNEAEKNAKREAEEKGKKEAEEKAKQAAADAAGKEAADKAKKEAEEKARRDAATAEAARKEAEGKTRAEAAKREAESAALAAAEKTRNEANERAREEAGEKAKKEAEEKARKDAEEKAKQAAAAETARKEAEEKARKAVEQAKKEAEEKAKKEAKERARKEAEEKAKRETEEKTRKEAEDKVKKEAEEKARKGAEEKARKEAEERTKKEAEDKAKKEADDKARKEAEEKARKEAEEKARQEAEEKAKKEAEAKARANSPLGSLPYGTAPGRCGPAVCILSTLSPPDGSHRIVQSSGLTESQRDFPTFCAEGVMVESGKWYYEVQLKGKGCVQLGAVIAHKFTCVSGRQTGVGNDAKSWAIDLSGPKLFNAGKSSTLTCAKWKENDVVGIALDLDAHHIVWTVNGAEVARVDLCAAGSDYKHGEHLIPAASVDTREGIFWRFVASDLKHLPTGFSPLQAQPTPWLLNSPVKQDEIDAAFAQLKQAGSTMPEDSLGDARFMAALVACYAPTHKSHAHTEKAIKAFATLRGAHCEYGFESAASKLPNDLKSLTSAFDGTLPKLEVKRSFANDIEAAEKKVNEMRTDMRRINWHLLALIYIYGHEEALRPVITNVTPLATSLNTVLREASEKLRYIAAIDNRKNGFLQYGLFWELERFNAAVAKDRSKMNEKDTDLHMKALEEQATRLTKWRAWFIEQTASISAQFSGAALTVLDEALGKYSKLKEGAAAEMHAKAVAKAEKDLHDRIEWGRKRVKEATDEFARFPERAEEKYKTLNAEIEGWRTAAANAEKEGKPATGIALVVSSPACLAWAAELRVATDKWRAAEDMRLLTREAENAIREVNSKVSEGLNMIDHHRKDDAIKCLHQAKELVERLKVRPGFFSLQIVSAFFDRYETERDKLEKNIAKWILDRETSDACRELRSAVDSVKDLFDHYRNDEALAKHHKAEELRTALQARKEWADIEIVRKTLAEAQAKGTDFTRQYKERVLTREAENKVRECNTALTSAKDMLYHSRFQEAMASLQKCKDLTAELKDNTALAGLPSIDEWLITFNNDAPALEAKLKKTLLDREVSDAVRELHSRFGTCEDHFNHYRFEMALTALTAYRDYGSEMERNTRFAGHPDAEEALRAFDANVPAFEAKYRSTMLQREYDNAIREANGKLSTANDMFDHHRIEEALAALHTYRDTVEAIAKREDFAALGGSAFVKTAQEELIPAWEKKYIEKVLASRCAEAVRGINTALGSARNFYEHYNEEAFLQALKDAETRMTAVMPPADAPAGSDASLIYAMPDMQEALKSAAQALWELKQNFDKRNRERLIDDAIRGAKTAQTSAADMLYHSRFEEALTELVRARNAADELASALFAVGQERVTSFLTTFRAELTELDAKLSATLRARRLDVAKRAVSTARSAMQNMFDHYRNDEALAELTKAKDATDALERDFTPAECSTEVASAREAFAAFETAYSERVLSKEAAEATGRAKGELGLAESHLSHSRFEKALESLSAARTAYAAVLLNARLQALSIVQEFSKGFDAKLDEVAKKIDTVLKERAVDEAIRVLRSSATEMDDHFSHHRTEAALASFSKTRSLLEALEGADNGPRKAEASAAASQVIAQLSAFQAKFRERELATKIRDMTGAATSRLGEAEQALEHSRFEEALEKSHAASAAAASVGADPMLVGAPEVESFLKTFSERSAALTAKWKSTVRARAEADAKRRATSAMTEAKDMFDHNRNEESLAKLQLAREAVDAFAAEFGASGDAAATSFINEQRKAQADFEAAYSEKVFKAELERKMGKARSRLSAAMDSLEHHRHEEALRTLQEADEACAVLASDERFLKHAAVSAFITQYNADAAALRLRIKNTLKERAQADLKRRLNSAMTEAENMYGHCRFEEALRSLVSLEGIMQDEEGASAETHPDIAQRVAAFKDKYAQEHLAREVEAMIKKAEGALSQSEFLLDHHRHEEALTSLHAAREAALALNDAKYDSLAAVKTFFAAWPQKVRTVQTAISARMLAKRAREASDEVRTPLNEAKTALDKHMHEAALERLQSARDKAAAVRALDDSADLCAVEPLQTTLSQFDAQANELSGRFAKEVYGKELQEQLRVVRSHMGQAEQLFERCAHEAALTVFQEARDAAVVLSTDSRFTGDASVSAFINGEWSERSKAFSTKYAEQVLTDEARKIVAEARAILSRAVLYTERNVRDKAEEALKDARAAATAILAEDSMMASLSVVTPFNGELRVAETAFAEKFLKEEIVASLKDAQKHLDAAARARSRALDDAADLAAARTASAAFLGTSLKSPVSSTYASLPTVATFVSSQLMPAFGARASELFEAKEGSGSAGGKKKGSKETIDGIIGPRFPQMGTLRKGLPIITIGTDVHPKFFSALKITNQAAECCNKNVKQLIDRVKSIDFNAKSSHASTIPQSIFHHTVVGYPVDGVEGSLVEFAKGLAMMNKDAKDEELTKKVAGQYESFSVAWRETMAVLKKLDELQKHSQGIDWVVEFISAQVKNFDGYCCSTCPRRIDLSFMPDYNPIGLDHNDMHQQDSTIFLFITRLCQRALEKIARFVKDFGGFPNEAELTKYLTETAMHAKKTHVQHCIRYATRASQECRKIYTEALRCFPLALAQAKANVEYMAKKNNERRDEPKNYPEWPNTEPAAAAGADPDEKPEWYLHEFIPIQPGTLTQFDKKPDMSSSGPSIWTEARRALAGKIVFSTQAIEDSGESKNLADKFNLADAIAGEGIYARAFWAHAVRNYAIAKRRDNGAPVFAPNTMNGNNHRLEVMTVVRVDGKPLLRPYQPHDTWSWFTWTSPRDSEKRKAAETTVDFYGWSQTCKFPVLSDKVHESLNDEWVRQAARFAYEFTRLPPGEHRVEIDLCFRIISLVDNFDAHPAQGRMFPEMDTMISTPLASGAFTLVVPSTPIERRSILPHRPSSGLSLPPAELSRLESVVIETMKKMPDWGGRQRKTEHPIHAVVTSDWYESDFETEVVGKDNWGKILVAKFCIRMGFEFTVVLRRLAKDGWSSDHVAVFYLAAYGPCSRNPPKNIPPMTGVGVARSFTLERELLKEF